MGGEAETASVECRKVRRCTKWLRFAGEGDGDGANWANMSD